LSPSTSAIKTGMKEDPQSAWWYWWLLVINDYIIEYNWWLISIIVPISCNVPGIWWSWLPISVTPHGSFLMCKDGLDGFSILCLASSL
jgi:hypothetical protein